MIQALRKQTRTIAFVDVVESVRLIAEFEDIGVRRIRALLNEAVFEVVPAFGGQLAERRGDGLILTFDHPRDAVQCVTQLHHRAAAEQAAYPGHEALRLRAGIHRTELLADGDAVYGAGVNLAARIAALGQPGDTLMSSVVRDELIAHLDGHLQDLGHCWLKHIEEPVRVFRHRGHAVDLPVEIEAAISARMRLRPTLVVLPLANPIEEAEAAFGLGDVAADQLIRELSRSSVLHVISILSARAFRGHGFGLADIFKALRADYILRGSIRSTGGTTPASGRIELRLELWRKGVDEPVWHDDLPGTAADLLSTQGDLLGTVAHAVSHRIVSVEQRAAQAAAALPNLSTHTLYLAAVDLLHRFTRDDFNRSHELLQTLSERAPRHAEPLAWLARWHVFRVVQGWSDDSRGDSEKALSYSDRALDRDPRSALALTMAGSVHAGVRQDPLTAQNFYEQALQSNPNDSLAWLMSGVAQGFLNAKEPALAASELALGLAPVDPTRHYYDSLSATAALRAGEFERCVALARRAIEANGTHGSAYRSLAIALGLLGRHDESREAVRRLLNVEPHFTLKTYLARVPSRDGNSAQFAQLLQQAGLPVA